jgi:hypothetical protein
MAGGEQFDKVLTGATVESTDIVDGVVLAAVRVSEDETSDREPVHGALGVGGRPLDQDDDGAAEAICARASDGLPVMALRDLRIEQGRASEPAKGTIYLAGYHGAEVRIDVADSSRSTITITDNAGRDLVLDGDGVRVPSSPLIQGETAAAKDVALAEPLVDLVVALYNVVATMAAAVNVLAPGSVDITTLTLKAAPYLVPGSPAAPTTRAPDLRGAPGA